MRNMRFLAAFAIVALVATAALAQEQVGSIEGTIVDQQGMALPGVTVDAVGLAGTLIAVTNVDGAYRFPRMPVGVYKLVARLSGFTTTEADKIQLSLGKALKVNFTMQAGIEEAIVVTADSYRIDTTQTQTATSIAKEQMQFLPSGRDFTSVVGEAAGAGNEGFLGGISIDGASGSENRFVIDGVDTTHPQDGVSGQNMITDFVEEVQVKTAGYAAEYGGSLGGVINAITKTGTNDFHGSVGVYYTGSSMEGKERKSTYESNCHREADGTYTGCYRQFDKDGSTRLEPGFSVGGPVLRDKLWFFAAYQPALTSNERQPDGNTKTYSQDQIAHYFAANLKGNIGSKLLYKFAVNMSPGTSDGILPAQDNSTPANSDLDVKTNFPSESYSLYLDAIPTDNFLISGRLGYWNDDVYTEGVDALTRFTMTGDICGQFPADQQTACKADRVAHPPAGFSSVPAGSFNSTEEDHWQRKSAGLDASYFFNALGSHSVKAGAQYEKISNSVSTGENGNLMVIRWGLADAYGASVKGTYGSLHVRRFRTEGAAESTNVSIFLQDSWQITKNLTVNYGLRAEQERVPNYGAKVDPTLPENAMEFNFKDKLAPRLGFAWDILGDQKMKLYGSYGNYYDITKLEMPRGSFGADKWIAYLYPIETLDWQSLAAGCSIATNNASINPCPALGTPVTRDLRHPSDPRENIDPDLRPMEQKEYQLGYEYQLNNTTVLGSRYVYKTLINTIEDIGYLDAEGNEIYTTGNPGKGLVAGDPDGSGPIPAQPEAVRNYKALELSYKRRFADNWSLMATYTYSKLEGNYSGLASSDEFGRTDPNVARYFDGLAYGFDSKGHRVIGPLNTDRPHAVELFGIYRFNFGTTVGVNTSWRNGTPMSTDAAYNGVNYFPNGRNDQGRTPNLTQTDLRVSHPFKIGDFELEFNVNVNNLFDEDTVTRYQNATYRTDVCTVNKPACDTTNSWYFGDLVPYDYNTMMKNYRDTQLAAGKTDPQNPFAGKEITWQGPRTIRLGVKFSF
jgi:outer membrane receptor protein involved in Fe transport